MIKFDYYYKKYQVIQDCGKTIKTDGGKYIESNHCGR